MSETPFQDTIDLLNTHDGMRFEGAKDLISNMRKSDIRLITDFCIRQERALSDNTYYEMKQELEGSDVDSK